ncbi:MAG: hypothetical protein NZ521_11950, partial [Flammeovirgaceae bacterium]|nr:hypothetical protein [Flammeovirgaceae bacterium]MDW8287946.1 hypothetical protein [Flammeovirgaceae bacterium]
MKNFWQYAIPDIYSLRGRLIWAFTGVVVLCFTFVAYPIYHLHEYINQYEFILENTVYAQRYSGMIEICLSKTNSALDNYLITNDGHFIGKRNRIWEKEFRPALDSLLTYTRKWNNETASTLVYDISVKANRLKAEQEFAIRQYASSLFQGDILQTEANKERKNQINQIDMLTEDILSVLDNLISLEEQEIQRMRKEIIHRKEELNIQIGILALIVLVVYAFVAIFITLQFIRNLNTIKYHLKAMAVGNIPATLPPMRDETASIANAINELLQQMSSLKNFAFAVGERKTHLDINFLKGELGNAFAKMTQGLKEMAEEEAKRNWAATG